MHSPLVECRKGFASRVSNKLPMSCLSECMMWAAPLMIVVGEQRAARGRAIQHWQVGPWFLSFLMVTTPQRRVRRDSRRDGTSIVIYDTGNESRFVLTQFLPANLAVYEI